MKDFGYVIENFFTHKDFLVPPHLIPGTIGTPLSIVFEVALLVFIIVSAVYVSKRKSLVKPVLVGLWAVLVVWEFGIVYWNSVSGRRVGLDLVLDLPLYPCSIYLYALPMIVWGNAFWRRLGCGYMATLGVLGAVVNFVYPVARLTTYSCISFAGFHTFSFHGSMLFTWLVLLRCGMLQGAVVNFVYPVARLTTYSCISFAGFHTFSFHGSMLFTWLVLLRCGMLHYGGAKRVRDLFTPCLLSLMVSIPANLINYSPIHGDYMYFRGQFPLVAQIFRGFTDVQITVSPPISSIIPPSTGTICTSGGSSLWWRRFSGVLRMCRSP